MIREDGRKQVPNRPVLWQQSYSSVFVIISSPSVHMLVCWASSIVKAALLSIISWAHCILSGPSSMDQYSATLKKAHRQSLGLLFSSGKVWDCYSAE